jgi:hypothetical protein
VPTLSSNSRFRHRRAAWFNRAGIDGPAFNKDGGVEFGGGWGANPTGSTAGFFARTSWERLRNPAPYLRVASPAPAASKESRR